MDEDSGDPLPPDAREFFRRIGLKYGKLGGKATAEKLTPNQRKRNAKKAGKASSAKLTPEQRSERAKTAAAARWKKKDATE